jgi:hypothetical protein
MRTFAPSADDLVVVERSGHAPDLIDATVRSTLSSAFWVECPVTDFQVGHRSSLMQLADTAITRLEPFYRRVIDRP